MARFLIRVLPDSAKPADPGAPLYLESAALDAASVALTNASRETLRMADLVDAMLRGAIEALRQGDRRCAADISRAGRIVERLGGAIRGYLADLGNEQPLDDEQEGARAQEILSAVINLEHISNLIANSLMEFAVKKISRSKPFSVEEIAVIAAVHAELLDSLRLAVAVFLNGDARDATRLVMRKAALRRMETQATALHVRQLRDAASGGHAGDVDKLAIVAEEGGLFLRIVSDLRRVHSHIATFAYSVLNRTNPDSAASVGLDRNASAERPT
jgi:phosphate:Na+ symporter